MKLVYGTTGQVHFSDAHEYYYVLGLLARAKRTSIVWEHNEDQGAWASEGESMYEQTLVSSLRISA